MTTTPLPVPEELRLTLDEWLSTGWRTEHLSGDASVRDHYRVYLAAGPSRIATWYPEALESDIARVLSAHCHLKLHVPVPQIEKHSSRVILEEDAGDDTLLDLLRADPELGSQKYFEAIDLITRFHHLSAEAATINPPFDKARFRAELDMTAEFYVERLAGSDSAAFRVVAAEIAEKLTRHPYVLCHRDFHGQNIHIQNMRLIVIDYQDLRNGPDAYDLASLLRDRGVARILGREREEAMIEHYRLRSGALEGFRNRYFETLLQRTLKIIGTFARQSVERGRRHYLDHIPPALETIRLCCDELPEFRSILEVFPTTYHSS